MSEKANDHDNEPGGSWRDELDSSMRAILRRGLKDMAGMVRALRVAMVDPSITEASARATAERIGAPVDAEGYVSPPPVAAS